MDTSQFSKIFNAMGLPPEPKKSKKKAAEMLFKQRNYKNTHSIIIDVIYKRIKKNIY